MLALTREQRGRLSEIKREIFEAGVNTGTCQQIDDTGMKIGGLNAYATIVCSERYSAFFINFRKNRETVKKFLTERVVSQFPVLVGDDAPQFKGIARRYALCWVHEERHYKKLNPVFGIHADALERVRGEIWAYYKKLKEYKIKPSERRKSELWLEFDTLFGQKTGYGALDDRLVLTMGKKEELLTVLDYPETPLHNNLSENGIREIVLKRKISGGVETEEGVRAWENNMSILATCKKLGVSFYEFMRGVFSKNVEINLAELIWNIS